MYRFMIGNDFQFPAQDDNAIDLWFQVMKYWKPDQIDLLGDISDGTEYSRHVTGGTTEFFNKHNFQKNENKEYNIDEVIEQLMDNEKQTRDFLKENRKVRKNAEIHVYEGNHDFVRVFDYFDKYYPEVLEHVTPQSLYGIDDIKAHYHEYKDPPVQRHGDLFLHHGNMVGTNAGDSVKKHIDAFGVSMVIGHCHRTAYINRTFNLRGEILRGYENGHMIDHTHPCMDYTNNKNWQQSFIVGLVDDDNIAHVNQVQIQNRTCMVNGKIFKA